MAAHTERMERFKNAIFKKREEINGKMTKMFRLLKELTTNRTLEKVLIREEAKSPITKGVNSISLIREEEEKNDIYDVETGDDSKGTNKPDMEVAIKEVETMNGAKNGAENMPIKKVKKEEVVEAHGSMPLCKEPELERKFLIKNGEEIFTDTKDEVRIYPDGVASPAM
ncbi:hypothetical protein Tco_0538207 [Tanacetum coccineum]